MTGVTGGRSVRGWGGPARVAVVLLLLVAVLFLFVFPTQSYLSQRRAVNDARHDVTVIREQNARLAEELERLATPEEIEARARDQHQMVYPGEQAYAVNPAPAPPPTTTAP